MKQDIKIKEQYFQVKVTWNNDIRMIKLEKKYGNYAIGTWLKINSLLLNNNGELPFDWELFKSNNEIDEKLIIEDIIKTSGYYVIENEKFSSPDIDEQLELREIRSEKARISANYRHHPETKIVENIDYDEIDGIKKKPVEKNGKWRDKYKMEIDDLEIDK